ncbi:MAG: hypothetical protein OXC60_02730 [Litoreibacter sp.]|nr:hypothetical protein [Litoreibacter sp.]
MADDIVSVEEALEKALQYYEATEMSFEGCKISFSVPIQPTEVNAFSTENTVFFDLSLIGDFSDVSIQRMGKRVKDDGSKDFDVYGFSVGYDRIMPGYSRRVASFYFDLEKLTGGRGLANLFYKEQFVEVSRLIKNSFPDIESLEHWVFKSPMGDFISIPDKFEIYTRSEVAAKQIKAALLAYSEQERCF